MEREHNRQPSLASRKLAHSARERPCCNDNSCALTTKPQDQGLTTACCVGKEGDGTECHSKISSATLKADACFSHQEKTDRADYTYEEKHTADTEKFSSHNKCCKEDKCIKEEEHSTRVACGKKVLAETISEEINGPRIAGQKQLLNEKPSTTNGCCAKERSLENGSLLIDESCHMDKIGNNTKKLAVCSKKTETNSQASGMAISESCCTSQVPVKSELFCAAGSLNCCDDPEGPCCTDECVFAYAQYDCWTSDEQNHAATETDSPCINHLQLAMEKYGAMLKRAICLCKNVSSSGVVKCCRRKASKTSLRAHGRTTTSPVSAVSNQSVGTAQDLRGCKQSGCEFKITPTSERRRVLATPEPLRSTDIENTLNVENVVVHVQGMTCTGCEVKLERTLNTIPGVSDIQVIFVNGRADFKVDNSITDIKSVITRVQDLTGFHITRMRREFHGIDVVISQATAASLSNNAISGVIDIEKLDKRTSRIFYEPNNIGARDLFKKLEKTGAQLAPVGRNGQFNEEKRHLYELAIKTGLAFLFTIPVCVLAWSHINTSELTKGIISMILATFVQLISVTEFYWKAFKALFFSRTVELDLLVVISITAAYVYSVVAFAFSVIGRPLLYEEFFETSTLLTSLVLLGRLLAGFARVKAIASVSMRSLQENIVTLLMDDGSERELDARLMHFNDVIKVRAHARIPTDGSIVQGESDVDESNLTGESTRVHKLEGSKVIAGTMNGQGGLHIKVDRLSGANTITDIANLVEAAQGAKPRAQDTADLIAGYFIPVVLTVALIVFVVWVPVSLRVRGLTADDAVITAISYTIAVLAVSCPCAIGLAVPLVLIIAGGVAARRGVIIKSASSTERAWSVTDVVFDKTGTLTTGDLTVSAVEVLVPGQHESALALSLALAKVSDHPVSRAVASHLEHLQPANFVIDNGRSIPGRGVEAEANGRIVRAGNPHWLAVQTHPEVQKFSSEGYTLLCVTDSNQLVAVFALTSTVRPEAATVIGELQRRGLRTHLVSGDAENAVVKLAKELGIPNVRFRQSPQDKCNYIDQIAAISSKRRILFCGDGTNDAVAVARADVGVSMGTTSDITGSTADATLLSTLDGLIHLLDLSKAAFRRIVFNFIWSGVYNLFAILLASGALVVFRLPPAYAGLGELVSVLPVVLAAATMLSVGGKRGSLIRN